MGKYVIKHYKICSKTKQKPAEVTTSTLPFICNSSQLQKEDELMPSKWRNKDSVADVQDKINRI